MPELPEVETVCRQLRERAPVLIGRRVTAARIGWARTIATPDAARFSAGVVGLRCEAVTRHGKNIIIGLAGARGARKHLLVHLRMSGRLDVVPRAEADTRHARVILDLDGNLSLRFDDARKFGRIWLVDDPAEVTGTLGPDALTIGADVFAARLRAHKGALKPVLLNQGFAAGIGNIYADESLFLSGLRPTRRVASLKPDDIARLHAAVVGVLQEGIRANGASFDWVYPGGEYQSNFRVYGQTDRPCVNCGRPITRIIVGQRSTHFCKGCQK